jgi:nucleotide-binding universal stress UspA family protein
MAIRILVPLDGSSLAAAALAHAIALAEPADTHLALLRVVERTTAQHNVDPLDWHLQRSEAQAYLDQAGNLVADYLSSAPETVLLDGRAADRIVDYARNEGFDFIVFTSHGRGGLSEWNMSSVASKIALGATTSILMVHPSTSSVAQYAGGLQPVRYRRILVPLDGSQRAEHVLPSAGMLAERHGAELVLLHVVAKPEFVQRMPLTEEENELVSQVVQHNQSRAIAYFDQLSGRLPVVPQARVLVEEDAAGAIHRFVIENQVDLVVLSAHGHTGRQQWPFGSLATSFLAYGTTSLLILQDMTHEAAPLMKLGAGTQTWREEGLRGTLAAGAMGELRSSYDRAVN